MTDTPAHKLHQKERIVLALERLHSDLKELQLDLKYYEVEGIPPSERERIADEIRTHVGVLDAEFLYINRLLEEAPEDVFEVNFYQPVDTVEEASFNAYEQFLEVLENTPEYIETGRLDESNWAQFYGHGYGHSYWNAIQKAYEACLEQIEDDFEQLEGQVEEREMDEQSVGMGATETTDATLDVVDDPHSSQNEFKGTGTSSTKTVETPDEGEDMWPFYSGEYLTTPEGETEPLGHSGAFPSNMEVVGVYYSMVLDPSCKSCSSDGRYLVTAKNYHREIDVYRVCASHLPDSAVALAPDATVWKEGRIQHEGELFSRIRASTNMISGGHEWIERHGISTGRHSDKHNELARITYEITGEKVHIQVFDYVTEYTRAATYSIEIDSWKNETPIVEGEPIGKWLTQQGKQHRKRLEEKSGIHRHLVPIDEDQNVVSRAKRAYRQKHPDFEQPSGMINDYTPATDADIPVCSHCGEIVAGITPEDAEPCEYCGSDEAEWAESQNQQNSGVEA